MTIWRKRTWKFYLKILCCLFLLLLYFAIFLQESIHATKLKQSALKQRQKVNSVGAPVEIRKVQFAGNKSTRKHPTIATSTLPIPSNSIYEQPESSLVEEELAARNQLLAEECANLKLSQHYPPNAFEFFVSPGLLSWCPVFKAASSTWLFYFNILGGYSVDYLLLQSNLLELARKRFPRPTPEELSDALATSTSFLIVREPFERLVSAYRNKFEGSKNKYYKALGLRIVRMFRGVSHENRTTTRAVARAPRGPTFEEFAKYIVNRVKVAGVEKINEHLAPIYSFCTPCTINFTYIFKTETLARDSEYLWRQTLLESLFDKLPTAKRLKTISNRSNVESKNVKYRYFSGLSAKLLEDLLNIYGPDFQLFGYNATGYYEVLKMKKKRKK